MKKKFTVTYSDDFVTFYRYETDEDPGRVDHPYTSISYNRAIPLSAFEEYVKHTGSDT